jgi:phospholipase C
MFQGAEAGAARRRLDRLGGGPDPGTRPRPAQRAGRDSLPQIQHIVILMQENHSYDNYLGMLRGRGDGLPLGAGGLPTAVNLTASGQPVPLTHAASTTQEKEVPTQSWAASHLQWADGALDGFVTSIETTLPGDDDTAGMRYWTQADLPFYYGLAETFPLATRWFSSCLGPTFPNRRFLISGTAHGMIDDVPFGMIDYPDHGTIFDQLEAHRISWLNYHSLPPGLAWWRMLSHARGLRYLRVLGAALGAFLPGLAQRLMSKVQFTADLYPLGLLRSLRHLAPMSRFLADAAAGTLPAVSIVDPDFRYSSEENPQDITVGEAFAAQIINAVMAGPGWPHTLLIWLYDEHGGYYDHVPPPPAPAPDRVPARGTMERFPPLQLLRLLPLGRKLARADAGPATYEQFGFRVPAVIVSPYARPGYVSDVPYDHTSVLRLIENKWNLPSLTHRDAAAADPLDALDLTAPPAFLTPPVLPKPARS